jgi:hypothetical protein
MSVLEGTREAVPPATVRPPARDVTSFELHTPGRRQVEAREDVDERRLPRAVRTDQADDLVAVQLERDVVESPDALEVA